MSGGTDRRPLLLLDVDGVLFPTRSSSAPPGYEVRESSDHRVWLNPSHGIALVELSAFFDLVWATTWEHKANDFIGRELGLPTLPVITFDDERVGDTWKLPAVARYIGSRPFVWVDDELYLDAHRWAANLPQPNLLICPRSGVGITTDQLCEIGEFLK